MAGERQTPILAQLVSGNTIQGASASPSYASSSEIYKMPIRTDVAQVCGAITADSSSADD